MISSESRKWWVLIALGAVAGLLLLDETVVGVALPSMRQDLGMTQTQAHWVISVYFLAFTAFAAVCGKLGDIIGFKNVVLVGGTLFGLASVVCGFASDGAVLIAARAVQGLGAAVLFPASMAMVAVAFPPEQRGMAIGVYGAIATIFMATGPLVGGLLTELLSWPWIFWINVPVVLGIIVVITFAWDDPPRDSERPRLDYAGLVTLVAGLGMVTFAVMQGASWGWTQPVILGLIVGGLVAIVLFVVIESRTETPLLEVDLFRSASFSATTLVLFIGQYCKLVVVVFGAVYLQDALGMSPLTTGFALLVAVAGFPILTGPVGRIADKHGARRPVLAGLAVATVAMAWLGVASTWDDYLLLLPGLIGWGLSMPFCYVPALRLIANSVAPEKQGQASGISATSRLVGGTAAVSISSTVVVATGSFAIVFLVTAALMLVTLLFGWAAIEQRRRGVD
ncbi:MAG: MFS transporter [Pseudomonadota bacterium]